MAKRKARKAITVRIDLTFPTEKEYSEVMDAFMYLIDIDLEHIPFECKINED